MKNFIIASLLLIGAGSFSNTLEIRYGADINNNGNIEYFKTNKKISGNGGSVVIEYHDNITEKLEGGWGIGYRYSKMSKDILNYEDEKTKGLHSMPLYLTGRYNFRKESDWTPYISANFGVIGQKGRYSGYTGTEYRRVKTDYKINSGWMYGASVGFKYKDYIVDLSYNINNSTIEGFHEIGNSRYINAPYSKTEFKDKKVRRSTITLSFGWVARDVHLP